MKKILMMVVALLLCSGVTAQTKFENIRLSEAVAKAKAENKHVMVMVSTTWCGFCKVMLEHIFPMPKVGDYLNENVVCLKYEVDVADPDSIGKMNVKSYPTFLFFDGNGEEVSRFCGMAGDIVESVKTAIAPNNSWKARAERLIHEPGYVTEHALYLQSVGRAAEGIALFNEDFRKKSLAETFTKENVDKYVSLVSSFNSPVIDVMLKNKKEVISLIGKENYDSFLQKKTSEFLFNRGLFHSLEKLDEMIIFVKANPELRSGMAELVLSAKDAILAKNGPEVFSKAAKYSHKYSDEECKYLRFMYGKYGKEGENQAGYEKFLRAMCKVEKDEQRLKMWNELLESVQITKNKA